TMHAASNLAYATGRDVGDTQPSEACFVASEGHPGRVGRHGERTLAHSPRRATFFECLVDQRAIAQPYVEPSRIVAQAYHFAVGHEADLLDRSVRRDV